MGIRAARADDQTSLLRIWRAAVESSHPFLTPVDVDFYENVVAGYLPRMRDLRVAVDALDQVIGFLAQDDGVIHMLFVAPHAQGHGVGSALLDDVSHRYETLRVDVNEQNPTARAFYAARGFRQTGRSELDGEGRPFPLLHLVRETDRPV